MTNYFATCARGLEPILAAELRALNAADVRPGRGGVAFAGDRALLYQANLWLRTAVRVLQPILEARVETPVVDPMCGSGSLPIEGGWIALKRPPGLTRKHFGFMGWMDFDVGLWTAVRDEARAGVLRKLPAFVGGRDVRADAIEHARINA